MDLVDGEAPAAARVIHSHAPVAQAAISSLTVSVVILALNLVTGIAAARLLGPNGRGELTEILVPPHIVGWVFAGGCLSAVTYHHARHPGDAPRLISTWLIVLAPLSVLAVICGRTVLPITMAAQSREIIQLAQLYMLMVIPNMFGELVFGVILGDYDIAVFNGLRLIMPAITAIAYLTLWQFGRFTVVTALMSVAGASLVGNGLGAARIISRHGVGAPSWRLARSNGWYGLRSHGTKISDLVNLRLDLTILPAFVGATSVGLYAVATTVSGLVMTLAESVGSIVLPAAARQGSVAVRMVIRVTQATFISAVVSCLLLGALAPLGVRWVYGVAFLPSVPAIWLLLPGTVLYAGASILKPGLYALNKPFTAFLPYALGMLVTVAGLLTFLRSGGIIAAAIVSSVAYAVTFGATLWLYSRSSGSGLRSFVPAISDVIAAKRCALATIRRHLRLRARLL